MRSSSKLKEASAPLPVAMIKISFLHNPPQVIITMKSKKEKVEEVGSKHLNN
jgi:hypothetical protein